MELKALQLMLDSESTTILGLIGLIYDAVPDASRWQTFLEALVQATGSNRGTLALRGSALGPWQIVCWYGWKDEEIRLYMERYAASDPWGVHDKLSEGEVCTTEELCPKDIFERSVAYLEFYQPCGIVCGCGGVILRTDAGTSAITVARGMDQGPCSASVLSLLRALMPHLRRAALLHGDHATMRSQLVTFKGHLDRYPQPFFLTDGEGRVLYANASGREITTLRDGLGIEFGKMNLTPSAQRKLRDAIAVVAGGDSLPLRHVEAPRPSGKPPYRLLVMNVPRFDGLPLGTSQLAAAIFVMDSESAQEPDPAVLRELFALTPAEARVTGRLMLGRSVEEIAYETRVSIETVRSQVRSALSKTNTVRQGQLISLVLRMAPFRRI